MNRSELLDFIRRNSIGVEATVSSEGHPQAALIGLVVSELSSDIAYIRVTVTWARFSDFRRPAPTITEFSAAELR